MGEFTKQLDGGTVVSLDRFNDVAELSQENPCVPVSYARIPLATFLGPMHPLVTGCIYLRESRVPNTLRRTGESEVATHVVQSVMVDVVDKFTTLCAHDVTMQMNQSSCVPTLDPSCSIESFTGLTVNRKPIESRELLIPVGIHHGHLTEGQSDEAVRFSVSIEYAFRHWCALCVYLALTANLSPSVFVMLALRTLIAPMTMIPLTLRIVVGSSAYTAYLTACALGSPTSTGIVFVGPLFGRLEYCRIGLRSDTSFARRHDLSTKEIVRLGRTRSLYQMEAA